MKLTVRQESPSVGKNVHYTPYLSGDSQSTPSQGKRSINICLWGGSPPERVAVQKFWQDWIEDLIELIQKAELEYVYKSNFTKSKFQLFCVSPQKQY